MAKFQANVVVIEETNLLALFYYKYLCETYNNEIKYPPVQYYDFINKNGIEHYLSEKAELSGDERFYENEVLWVRKVLSDISKTCYHGFAYTVIHESVKDEGLAKKYTQSIQKSIKKQEEPYSDIFKKYSAIIAQG